MPLFVKDNSIRSDCAVSSKTAGRDIVYECDYLTLIFKSNSRLCKIFWHENYTFGCCSTYCGVVVCLKFKLIEVIQYELK